SAAGIGGRVQAQKYAVGGEVGSALRYRLRLVLAESESDVSVEDGQEQSAVPLEIVAANSVTQNELGFTALSQSTLVRVGLENVGDLLPPEGESLAIIVDALAGNDRVDVGPTVLRSVWVDAGASDDVVDIASGRAILVDQSELSGRGRNDEVPYVLSGGEESEGSTPIHLRDGFLFSGLSIDSPNDVDWYAFAIDLPENESFKPGDAITVSEISVMGGLEVELYVVEGSRALPILDVTDDEYVAPHRGFRVGQSLRIPLEPSLPASGDVAYFLRVTSSLGPTEYEIEFSGSDWAEQAGDEFNNKSSNDSLATAMVIEQIETRSGVIASSINLVRTIDGLTLHAGDDQDWFRFDLPVA